MIALLGTGCGKAPSIEAETESSAADLTLEDSLKGAMVQIVSGSNMGSGVIYTETETDWVIVTAGHVLEEEKSAYVTFYNDAGCRCDRICSIDDSDLAFLFVEKEKTAGEKKSRLHSVTLDKEAYDGLQIGEPVVAVASYRGIGEDICDGEVKEKWIYAEDLQEMIILLDMKCFPGMSGGGVFDLEGHFMGIICSVGEENKTAVIPYLTIQAKIAEYRL